MNYMGIKELISKIERNNGIFPQKEIEQLIENRDHVIPELLAMLENTRDNIDDVIEDDTYFAHMYATYLLAQFREFRAYKIIFEILCNPEDKVESIYGDSITGDMDRILASVSCNDISLITKLIEDDSLNEYVRGAAVSSLLILVAQKERTREEIISYFRSLFEGKLKREYSQVWNSLVSCASRLYPEELMSEIKKVFEEGLIDEFYIGFENIQKRLKIGKEVVLKKLEKEKSYTFIEDTICELKNWACFESVHKERLAKNNYGTEKFVPNSVYKPKIGRNDPCPCRSGKKYKKCCG